MMPWAWRAAEQWMLARPKLVRELKQKGVYYQTLVRKSEAAAEMGAMLINQGVDPQTAQELALENLFPPPRRPAAESGGEGQTSVLSNYILPAPRGASMITSRSKLKAVSPPRRKRPSWPERGPRGGSSR